MTAALGAGGQETDTLEMRMPGQSIRKRLLRRVSKCVSGDVSVSINVSTSIIFMTKFST